MAEPYLKSLSSFQALCMIAIPNGTPGKVSIMLVIQLMSSQFVYAHVYYKKRNQLEVVHLPSLPRPTGIVIIGYPSLR